MKIVENYNDCIYSKKNKLLIYEREHEIYHNYVDHRSPGDRALLILQMLPPGPSVWIDSFAHAFEQKHIVSFEMRWFKEVFDDLNKEYKIHLAGDFKAKRTLTVIEKIYSPSSIVFYFSAFLKYHTVSDYADVVRNYCNFFQGRKILFLIDLRFMIFNRIRSTNDQVIEHISESVQPRPITTRKLDTFKYMLEIN